MTPDLPSLGRALMWCGLVFLVVGGLLLLGGQLPWMGRLPGDIAIRRDGFSFYLPLATCLVLSAFVSAVLWLVGRFR